MTRLIVSFVLLVLALLARPTPAHADGGDCNQFESVQSVILAEGAYQPLAAQIEMARVAVGHGACSLDGNFYAAYGLAVWVRDTEPSHCMAVWACRSFFLLYSVPPAVRESAAVASHVALTEQPRVRRFHFDAAGSTAYWWNSKQACPGGFWEVGSVRVC